MLKPYYSAEGVECGCDEAGRGCLAGPVVAAAVILLEPMSRLDDSKKLSSGQRSILEEEIKKKSVCWAIGVAMEEEIDQMNILNASIKAMHRAISKLRIKPDLLLVDGNRFEPFRGLPHHCIVKGDSQYQSIAAASILAKTFRDRWMVELHKRYPQYGWETNKGYPTPQHFSAIADYGVSEYHRKSFSLYKQLSLF